MPKMQFLKKKLRKFYFRNIQKHLVHVSSKSDLRDAFNSLLLHIKHIIGSVPFQNAKNTNYQGCLNFQKHLDVLKVNPEIQ